MCQTAQGWVEGSPMGLGFEGVLSKCASTIGNSMMKRKAAAPTAVSKHSRAVLN